MAKPEWKTTVAERLSYGGYSLGQNIAYLAVLQYLMLFFTDVVGIGAAAVGVMFFIARTWDAVNDPMLGILVDKTNPKKGKFMPWITAVIFLIPVSTIFLFLAPALSPTGKLIYAYASYIIWGMIYTISDVPFFALSTVMTDRVDERVSLVTIGRFTALIGGVLAGVAFMPMVRAMGWTTTIIVLAGIMVITMLPIRFLAKERIKHDRSGGVSFKEIWRFFKSNKPMLIYYAAFLIISATNTALTVTNYFAIYALGDTDGSTIAMLNAGGLVPMLLMIPLLPWLIKTLGKPCSWFGDRSSASPPTWYSTSWDSRAWALWSS